MKPDRRKFLRAAALLAAGTVATRLHAAKFSVHEPARLLAPRLKKGDLIALTAPAGAIFNEDSIQRATTALEAAGYKVKQGDTLKQRYGYLAGEDTFRATELNNLFGDKEVKGIIAMRGGWGCARLLRLIDFKQIGANPKVFSGFSDITTLLLAIYQQTGLITFHGPVGNSSWGDFTINSFLKLVQEGEASTLAQPYDAADVISGGNFTGKLLGGNLTVLCSLIGSGYLPDFTDSILFLEETEEEPYSIDRMLTQLDLNGTLAKAGAVVFGNCAKCIPEEPDKSFTLDEVFAQKFGDLKKPVMKGFSFGHTRDKFTIPVGAVAYLDTASFSIKLQHGCVE
ncbi:MAG TPA: LD-carboxypeptidase [Bacteroidia bacterium]|nr:LD-carboxypeptidase [Bacteroidia bacterium]